MKLCCTFVLILIINLPIFAQKENLAPCGSPSFRSEWLKNFQANKGDLRYRSDDMLYIPLTIHLVSTDDGKGMFLETSLAQALCTLNADFLESNMQFFIQGPVRQIRSTRYTDHGSILTGAEMMFEHNVAGTLNNYVVDNPAGNCGYNLPYAGIALSDNCLGANDHTWAHEIGHAFSLPHPFLGWEGGVSHDGSVAHNFENPAPEYVLYDYTLFKDTLILDTLIIDTAYVELLDGSNCNIAADGFCDTKADYLASRWLCNDDYSSIESQTDPLGNIFYSDATLIMSYALDNCSYRFTDDQIAAMRANVYEQKPELLSDQSHPGALASELSTITTPTSEQQVYFQDIELAWTAVQNAENYLLQINLGQNGSFVLFDSIVSDQSLILSQLDVDKKYYARVRALGKTDFCSEWSDDIVFVTADVSASEEVDIAEVCMIYPNLVSRGQAVYLNFEDVLPTHLRILDITGQRIRSTFDFHYNEHWIPTDQLSPGVYIVQFVLDQNMYSTKITIVH